MTNDIKFEELMEIKWDQVNIMKQIVESNVGIVLAELQVKMLDLKTREKDLKHTFDLTEEQSIELEGLDLLLEVYSNLSSAQNEIDKSFWSNRLLQLLQIISDPINSKDEISAASH